MKKIIIILIQIFCFTSSVVAQHDIAELEDRKKVFIGYDLGEMAFNKFQNFAGEVGVKFNNDHMIRFVYLNIKLTEAHLSSGFVSAVDGDNVTGLWHGYELLYDLAIFRFKKTDGFLYAGPSVGYHNNAYQHTLLEESVDHKSATVGFDIGFRETNIFKLKGLYLNFQIPVRYYFTKLEETNLGDATINESVISQTISFFVGYEF